MNRSIIISLYVLACLLIATTVAQANPLAFQVKTATPTKPPTSTKTPTPTNTPTNTPTITPTPTNTAIPERIIKECSTGKGVKTFGHPTKIVTYTFSLSLECIKQLQNGQSVTPMVEAKLYVIGAGDGCVAGSTAGTFKTDGLSQSTIRNNDKGEPAWLDVTVEYPPTNDSYWNAYWCQRVKVVFQQNLPTSTPTATVSPTNTPTSTATPTKTPTGTPTSTPLPPPTATPWLTPTDTPTDTPTFTPTFTPSPTNTPTQTPTKIPTQTPTNTPTNTPWPTNTFTPIPTPTNTPTDTPLPTNTFTPTPTDTPLPTNTFTPTPTPTPTPICNPNAVIPEQECQALQSLYESTAGKNWYWQSDKQGSKWLEKGNICGSGFVGGVVLYPGWYGVGCTNPPTGKKHVISLNLSDSQLNGFIPADLDNLTQLQSLDLSNNQLSGSIPSALGNLLELQIFNLSNNQLSDSIPPELGNLLELRILNLSNNQLSGSILPALGELLQLQTLNLSYNQLSGAIPAELYATPRLTLTTLALNHNPELTGTLALSISNLTGLKQLEVQSTSLRGRLPVDSLLELHLETMSYTQTQLCEPSGTITFTNWISRFETGQLERNFEPCTYSISGRLTDDEGQPVSGGVTFKVTDTAVLLALSRTRANSTANQHALTIDENGYYVLDNFASGMYIIKPVADNAEFVPLQRVVTVLDNDVTGQDFFRRTNYTITGQVTDATKQPIVDVAIDASSNSRCLGGMTDSNGLYTITHVFKGEIYTLTPIHMDYTFLPLTRSVTVNGNVTGQNFTGYSRTYTVTGQVTDAVDSENLDQVAVSAEGVQVYTATIDAGGLYTVANLLKNTYVFTARQTGYEFNVKEVPAEVLVTQDMAGPTFERLNPSRTFTISGQVVYKGGEPISQVVVSAVGSHYQSTTDDTGNYTITTVEKGQYTLMPKKEPLIFSPTERLVIVNQDVVVNFTATTFLTSPIKPEFGKGANWLQAQVYTKDNYVEWNLDKSDDILNKDAVSPIMQRLYSQGIKNVIRLGSSRPTGEVLSKTCTTLEQEWIKTFDEETYQKVIKKLNIGEQNLYYFIFSNEPNHQVEWGYNGYQYAHLYNCYYQYWKKQLPSRKNHLLYAAGPGRPDPARIDLPNETTFYTQLFSGPTAITQTDGFAIHVYGYSQADSTGGAEFIPWLSSGITNISANFPKKPVLITEYNPGSTPGYMVPIKSEGWQDWFDETYCFVKNSNKAKQIKGLLYFVDAAEPTRVNTCSGDWCEVSLQRGVFPPSNKEEDKDNRREAWLNFPSQNCKDTKNKSRNWQVSTLYTSTREPFGGNPLPIETIGGVISGTLDSEVYLVTQDLYVPPGKTLVLERGVWGLIFSPTTRLIVAGKLEAGGVNFIPTEDAIGWEGIHFLPSSQGSECIYCSIYNIHPGGTAIMMEAPITFSGQIMGVPWGTAIAISSTLPVTVSHVTIDQTGVGTTLRVMGNSKATHHATHLTAIRCEQGIVNSGNLVFDNSIIADCDVPITTELSGTTQIAYNLFYKYKQKNITQPGSTLLEGAGMLYDLDPKFIDFPSNLMLQPNSPAVDAGDPLANYSYELGFNGGRVDMGADGNTNGAPENPPLEKMGVKAWVVSPTQQIIQPGQPISFSIKVKNTGVISDYYYVGIDQSRSDLYNYKNDLHNYSRLYEGLTEKYASDTIHLGPQLETTLTAWMKIPIGFVPDPDISHTIHLLINNPYDVGDAHVYLEVSIPYISEIGGQAILESEEYIRQTPGLEHQWLTQTTIAGYSGHSYVTAWPDSGLQVTTTYTTAPKLSYTINFSHTGFYYVWLRGYAPDDKEGDSVYVALDDDPAQVVSGFTSTYWNWRNWSDDRTRVAVLVKEPGLHTFNVWLKEDGFALDRILLTQEMTYRPTGFGPAAGSPTNLLNDGDFDNGDLTDWELPYPGLVVTTTAAHSGEYGIKMDGKGRMDYTFETVPGRRIKSRPGYELTR